MDTNIEQLKKLRAALPFQFAKIISDKLPGINADQVRNVFTGSITDPNLVLPVLEQAWQVVEDTRRINELKERANELA